MANIVPDPNIVASLSNAIAGAEGYGASATNLPTRSNNPGDIGNTGYAQQGYPTPEAGWAALDHQVALMFSGQGTRYNPNMTIAQVGALYAKNLDGSPNVNWPKAVASRLGVSQNTTLAQIASGEVAIKSTPRPYTAGSSNPSGGDNRSVASLTDDSDPAVALPVYGMQLTPDQLDAYQYAIQPPLIIDEGLDQEAWDDDLNILQVNGATAAIGDMVTFQIFFNLAQNPLPVVITLNASLKTHQRSMRHLTTKQKTLTGLLVNIWGSALDQISGQASTGLFANQLGVTDFLSLSTVPEELKEQVIRAFSSASDDIEYQMDSNDSLFRVAAKDAFVEFLALFKNNGNVWFRNQNYTGYTTGLEQTAPDVWSPATGTTTFQNAARRNDVMTRGQVVMYFRNAAYSGYFKTLSWTMDAKTPFRWNFNFVFQVESTITNMTVPQL